MSEQKTEMILQSESLLVSKNETAVSAAAAQAVASVQARYAMARAAPRDLDQVRIKLLKECKRPRFAEVALYNKPIGQGVVGFSIRFAEAALRCMGNVMPEVMTIFDDESKRIVRVAVTDLESNLTYTKDVTINKTVERRKVPGGMQPISQRTNSRGQTVYTIPATDDDILNKENALVSKAIRTVGLRLIPGDILDEALALIHHTSQNSAAQDPDTARKRLVDGFASIGIQPADLVAYLRHGLDKITPAEMTQLRSLYTTIRDGETTWVEVMDNAESDKPDTQAKTNATKEALEQKRKEKKQEPKKEPEPDPQHDYGPPALTEEEQAEMEGAGF